MPLAPGMSAETVTDLRAKARRARLHSAAILDRDASEKLRAYAEELEARAVELENE